MVNEISDGNYAQIFCVLWNMKHYKPEIYHNILLLISAAPSLLSIDNKVSDLTTLPAIYITQ